MDANGTVAATDGGAAEATTNDHLRSFLSGVFLKGARVRHDLTEAPWIGSSTYDVATTQAIGKAVQAALATPPADQPGGDACNWGGANDCMTCRTCLIEYDYRREERPVCPRLTPPAPVSTDSSPSQPGNAPAEQGNGATPVAGIGEEGASAEAAGLRGERRRIVQKFCAQAFLPIGVPPHHLPDYETVMEALCVEYLYAAGPATADAWEARYVEAVRERDEARIWIDAATKAITKWTGGGSEFFVQIGEQYRSDLTACDRRIHNKLEQGQHIALKAIRGRQAAEAQCVRLKEALVSARKRFGEIADGRAFQPRVHAAMGCADITDALARIQPATENVEGR